MKMRRIDRFRRLVSVLLVSAITMAFFSACSLKKGDRIEDEIQSYIWFTPLETINLELRSSFKNAHD